MRDETNLFEPIRGENKTFGTGHSKCLRNACSRMPQQFIIISILKQFHRADKDEQHVKSSRFGIVGSEWGHPDRSFLPEQTFCLD